MLEYSEMWRFLRLPQGQRKMLWECDYEMRIRAKRHSGAVTPRER